jgi:FkbM family methyltransferase
MSMLHTIRKLLLKLGIEVNRYNLLQSASARMAYLLKYNKIDLVIDIGANDGGYGANLRSIGYKGNIISFEPTSNAYKKLLLNSEKDKSWFIAPRCAVGNFDGFTDINISLNSVSSSIFKMMQTHKKACPASVYKAKEKCSVIKLDSFRHDWLKSKKNIFLKIDVQGYEHLILQGAKKFLKNTRGIQIELSLVPLYEKQRLYLQLINILRKNGFYLWNIVPGFTQPLTGRLLQFDGVFFR